jgi:hypothetical protein
MSQSSAPPTNEEMIEEQIDKCFDLLADIIEPRIDVESDDDVYQKIDEYFGWVEQSTRDSFQDRFNTAQLYNYLRYVFLGLADEQGYRDKLQREVGGEIRNEDNVVNAYRWFKTYSTVLLDEEIEISYTFALENLNEYREDEIAHPKELLSPDQQADPVLLSSLLLIWNALEGVIRTWGRILDLDDDTYEERRRLLDDDHDFHIGFVDHVEGRVGYVTSFQEGEAGKSIRIEPQYVEYFPSEGDVVILKAEQQYNHNDEPFSSLTPVIENNNRVRKFVESNR